MIEIGGYKVFAGEFHTHWYWDVHNPTCYLAGMKYLDLDFAVLNDGRNRAEECDALANSIHSGFRFFPGLEVLYDFAHIVNVYSDQTDENQLSIREGKPSAEDAFLQVKQNSALTVFAHPTRNWTAAYHGSYQPVVDLYQKGLIDAIQPESAEIYEEINRLGVEIPVVAGFDVHGCERLDPLPDYLYSTANPTLDHIVPMHPYITLVFAESLSREHILAAVRNGQTVMFHVENDTFVGPTRWTKLLQDHHYAELRRERMERRNKLKMEFHNMLVQEKGKIVVEGESVKSLSFPVRTASEWVFHTAKGNEIEVERIPQFNNREMDYYPLGVTYEDGETDVFAVLVQEPVYNQVSWYTEITEKGSLRQVLECKVKNRAKSSKLVQISLSTSLDIGDESTTLQLPPESETIYKFFVKNLENLGHEFDIDIRTEVDGRIFCDQQRVSFPVCRELQADESPWKTSNGKIILNSELQVDRPQVWQGPDDLSAEISLYWDKEYFYFYAEVTDSHFYQVWTDWTTFWGDSIQFAFDPFRVRSRGYNSNYEYAIAKTENGNELFLWYAPQTEEEKLHSKRHEQKRILIHNSEFDMVIERDEEKKVTYYRLKMPWKLFAPFQPETGARFNFLCMINDNDGDVLVRRCILYYGFGKLYEGVGAKDIQYSHEVLLV